MDDGFEKKKKLKNIFDMVKGEDDGLDLTGFPDEMRDAIKRVAKEVGIGSYVNSSDKIALKEAISAVCDGEDNENYEFLLDCVGGKIGLAIKLLEDMYGVDFHLSVSMMVSPDSNETIPSLTITANTYSLCLFRTGEGDNGLIASKSCVKPGETGLVKMEMLDLDDPLRLCLQGKDSVLCGSKASYALFLKDLVTVISGNVLDPGPWYEQEDPLSEDGDLDE